MELLHFLIGEKNFCLPLSSVSRIVPIPPAYAYSGQASDPYYGIDGNVFPYVSLWDLLDIKSKYLEYEELKSFLEIRRKDHLDWIADLENSILNHGVFTKSRNPRECAFGKWYYAYTPKHKRLSLLLSYFERPHALIHELADTLLTMAETGRADQALLALKQAKDSTLMELLTIFESTIELVVDLQRRLIVLAKHDAQYLAIGIDAVIDIVDVSPAMRCQNPIASSQHISEFVSFDNGQSVPIINLAHLASNASLA
ncbi:hypothetical protein [Methylomonas albis]|uniref:CZB domain-containing protein n=1 Tax=Methylomonas albis TaxID=1854563 RepID=A0ABR9D6R5_9GAMM|nr:CZB domain-containing protein [Methylomonas albis]MBD9357924.1 CZB domain-containing protein [Methylomonas albis]CAD6881264.1 hypothetical protein [Methylomonas albis]